jgi:hypothetical protein
LVHGLSHFYINSSVKSFDDGFLQAERDSSSDVDHDGADVI